MAQEEWCERDQRHGSAGGQTRDPVALKCHGIHSVWDDQGVPLMRGNR